MAYLQEAWETDKPIEEVSRHLQRTPSAIRERLRGMKVKRGVGVWLK